MDSENKQRKTTLNVYSHITDTMREQAAVKIDRSIGGTDAQIPRTENNRERRKNRCSNPTSPKSARQGRAVYPS